jgi:hypothetical protein
MALVGNKVDLESERKVQIEVLLIDHLISIASSFCDLICLLLGNFKISDAPKQ